MVSITPEDLYGDISAEAFDHAQDSQCVDSSDSANSAIMCMNDGADGMSSIGDSSGISGMGESGCSASSGTGQGCSAGMGM